MEFIHNAVTYRLERGRATRVWLLVENVKLEAGNNWRLITTFDSGIYDEDVQDRAVVWLKEKM